MDVSSQDSGADVHPELILGHWCYRDVFKQQFNQEVLNQKHNSSIDLLGGGQVEAQYLQNDHSNEHKSPFSVALLQKVLHNTNGEVQQRMDDYLDILGSRNPHRVRLMKDFPRPPNMPDKIFMESLWQEFRSSEKSLCEEHLGPDATSQDGGYRKAFQSLQRIHGIKNMDDLLKEKVKHRWKSYLSHDASTGPLIFKPQSAILGSRKIDTIRDSIIPDPTGNNTERRDSPPEGAFRSRKRARMEDPQTTIPVPRHLPNLAEQHHRVSVPIQRPRRRSTLRKEIRYNESSESD